MATRLTLGHSPDSDDAFMFHGLASGQCAAEDLEFEHILRDIQTLNEWAREGRLDCTAISVHAYAFVRDKYAILAHGASMGDGYGPMVVARDPLEAARVAGCRVAIPGEMTSAFLALRLCLDRPFEYTVMPFESIMHAVADGEVDAGLIIHEGQLTHVRMGLYNVLDLGAWWKGETGLPLPLGVNTIKRSLPPEVQSAASRALKASIVYGLEHRADALAYALQFGRGVDEPTADTFVGMYVNDWTVDMGEDGRRAIRLFLHRAAERGFIPDVGEISFVD